MLYPAIDMQNRKVTDIILGGEAGHLFQELIDLYNRMTGEKRTSFASLDEAKRMCIEAVHRSYFPEAVVPTPVTAPPREQIPPVPVQAQGAITPPWARSVTENGNNPNPPPAKPVTVAPTSTPSAEPSERHEEAQGPVARARMVFDQMAGAPRKDVIEACAKLGIKRSTASTQYQAWKKARSEQHTVSQETGMPQLAPGSYVGGATQH